MSSGEARRHTASWMFVSALSVWCHVKGLPSFIITAVLQFKGQTESVAATEQLKFLTWWMLAEKTDAAQWDKQATHSCKDKAAKTAKHTHTLLFMFAGPGLKFKHEPFYLNSPKKRNLKTQKLNSKSTCRWSTGGQDYSYTPRADQWTGKQETNEPLLNSK